VEVAQQLAQASWLLPLEVIVLPRRASYFSPKLSGGPGELEASQGLEKVTK